MLEFVNVLQLLSENGWSGNRLIKEKQISNGTLSRLRKHQSVSTTTIETICRLCHCQPNDIMRYVEVEEE